MLYFYWLLACKISINLQVEDSVPYICKRPKPMKIKAVTNMHFGRADNRPFNETSWCIKLLFWLTCVSEATELTFPGMKQQRLESTYFMKVMFSKERRVSTAARMSAWRASEWFLLSDSRLKTICNREQIDENTPQTFPLRTWWCQHSLSANAFQQRYSFTHMLQLMTECKK